MEKTCTHCNAVITKHINPRTVRPFCGSECYGLWQRGRKFEDQGKPKRHALSCKISDCTAAHFGRGYCRKHYLSCHYSPPRAPTKHTKRDPLPCAHCGTEFIARHASPKYCSIKCASAHRRKPFIVKKGYRKLLIPSHPRADAKGYVFEHIVVAEALLGRALVWTEEVHHIDHDKQNNDPSNLLVCADHAEHMKHHARPPCSNE